MTTGATRQPLVNGGRHQVRRAWCTQSPAETTAVVGTVMPTGAGAATGTSANTTKRGYQCPV